MRRAIQISERGETLVNLTAHEAAQLQALDFCKVLPTGVVEAWRVSAVKRVGVVAIGDLHLFIQPKTSLRSLMFMASFSGHQLAVGDEDVTFERDASLPEALVEALTNSVRDATARGLLKGYEEVEESAALVRGRWDVRRQLMRRPGLPLPIELTYDDYSTNVIENRVLHSAIRAAQRIESLSSDLSSELAELATRFADVGLLARGSVTPSVRITRLNAHYGRALRLARWLLDAVSWAHAAGETSGSTFLVDVAKVYEDFVGVALRQSLSPAGIDVELQHSAWCLDDEAAVSLRPDIVLSRRGVPLTVADTKYKVWDGASASPPNADVYQALAYAITAGVTEAHLLYVSGDVAPQTYTVTATGTRVVAHALDISGDPAALLAQVADLAQRLVGVKVTIPAG